LELVKFSETAEYEPAGHHGVINRLLAGIGRGGIDTVSVWHGSLAPGAGSDLHVHEGSTQIYIGLTGLLVVTNGATAMPLEPGDAVIVPVGERHDIHNQSDEEATLLVVSAPSLR
jgi:mannose-6-phosphate isomerase-like protein (cupin superfamily)